MSSVFRALVQPAALCGLLVFGGCSGGGSPAGVQGTSGDFVVLRTEPATNGRLFLNDPIRIDFSNPIDINTANLNTVAFQVFDAVGNPLTEQPTGSFRLARSPGDAEIGRRLEFIPRLPTNNAYSNGGFRPGRRYLIQLIGGDRRQNNVLLDAGGNALASPVSVQFITPDGTTPGELFRDSQLGGPRKVSFSVTGGVNGSPLNKNGLAPVEVVLKFNQPLNPSNENVPVDVDTDPSTRTSGGKGRIFMEYDDLTLGPNRWIPADVELRNGEGEREVILRPVGVLPNNALIRVIVENTMEDLAGESNTADVSYDRIFDTFTTARELEPQFDALVQHFDSTDALDFGAPFLDPVAEINNGFIKANFEFEGSTTILDYQPATSLVDLNTDFTQIVPRNGPPINVSGGVFQFRDVTIPAGVTVRGSGRNPMVWLVTGDFVVDGILSVDGSDGARVDTLGAANFATPGGVGAAGGGNGGRASPNTQSSSPSGEAGFGAGQIPGIGGGGGQLAAPLTANGGCGRGSGGGGGAYSTQGDPFFKVENNPGTTEFVQQLGQGGFGCGGPSGATSRTLPGGVPGLVTFTDSRDDNNFWGGAVDLQRQIRITGELAAARGGSGGGGGGDMGGPNAFPSNAKGGGGGGGGGVLIIKALGEIRIGASGRITANGGNGGGGEQAGGNNLGGGGGGGSGGMVVLMAGKRIVIVEHGNTYAEADPKQPGAARNGEFDFAISADGGVGTQGNFGGRAWDTKYPPPSDGKQWDGNPAGALGGLGVVQLMAPAGETDPDMTGTVLDDNIHFEMLGGGNYTGEEKQRRLAWRGFPNDQGFWVDDNNDPTYNNPDPGDPNLPGVGVLPNWCLELGTPAAEGGPGPLPNGAGLEKAEGEIRPAPILLPAPFGSKSRVRTAWLDVGGGSVRLDTGVVGPRTITGNSGPRYEFAGTNTDKPAVPGDVHHVGYVDYVPDGGGGIKINFPEIDFDPSVGVLTDLPVLSVASDAVFGTQPAFGVGLVGAQLGTIDDRYAHYQAYLIDATSKAIVGRYRILGHDARTLFLATDQDLLPAQTTNLQVRIVAQFFDIITNGIRGLGPTYDTLAGGLAPVANVRIGFAFHEDPAQALTSGIDNKRFPTQVGSFLYDDDPDPLNPQNPNLDLSDPATQDLIESRNFRFIKWDILFNTGFSETESNNLRGASVLGPATPRPELHFLVIPYRF